MMILPLVFRLKQPMIPFTHASSHLVTMLSASLIRLYFMRDSSGISCPWKACLQSLNIDPQGLSRGASHECGKEGEKNRSLVILIRWSVKLRLPDVSVCIWVDGNPSHNPLLSPWASGNGGWLSLGVKQAVGEREMCHCASVWQVLSKRLEQVENTTAQRQREMLNCCVF